MDKIKTIGKRKKSPGGLVNTNNLLKLVIELRGNKPFYPKGLYRFKSFEEKEEWEKKMRSR
ncbi:hypothetical protein H8E88_21480 [candidate division KSB1 bacterium]|nr:hypothetical protein [candidate division KSB1 bacterium]MBL7094101.1 hypothetical protein [candidate division KSB1 bacterium]